jgi:hypothetical protein
VIRKNQRWEGETYYLTNRTLVGYQIDFRKYIPPKEKCTYRRNSPKYKIDCRVDRNELSAIKTPTLCFESKRHSPGSKETHHDTKLTESGYVNSSAGVG